MIFTEHHRSYAQRVKLLATIYLLWAGIILGVSFIATPVKFQAPHLTVPIAIEVGKATFHLFSKIELILLIGVALLAGMFQIKKRFWFSWVPLSFIVLSQRFWLLPALDIQADIVIAGGNPSLGYLHLTYIVLECLKVLLLIVGAKMISATSVERNWLKHFH